MLTTIWNLCSWMTPPSSRRTLQVRETCNELVMPLEAPETTTTFEGCFITSIFGLSPEQIDRPNNATKLREQYPGFDFILFTNLAEMEAPGWRKVLYFHPHLNRFITQSRFGKFVAWKHATVADRCPFVVYVDGMLLPIQPREVYLELGNTVRHSKFGLMQRRHPRPGGLRAEMAEILQARKDTIENMNITERFLESQSDMNWDCQMYVNNHFGTFSFEAPRDISTHGDFREVYDPNNQAFRTVTEAIWNILTKEHGSWRDQPYWCYTLHRFQITPIDFPKDTNNVRTVFANRRARLGRHHVYDDTTNAEVELFVHSLNTTRCGVVHALRQIASAGPAAIVAD